MELNHESLSDFLQRDESRVLGNLVVAVLTRDDQRRFDEDCKKHIAQGVALIDSEGVLFKCSCVVQYCRESVVRGMEHCYLEIKRNILESARLVAKVAMLCEKLDEGSQITFQVWIIPKS